MQSFNSPTASRSDTTTFHSVSPSSAFDILQSRESGLTSAEVADRFSTFGPNELTEAKQISAWRRLLTHLVSPLNAILVVAAIISTVVADEVKTTIVVLTVVIANAVIGFIQENRANASLQALKKMLSASAKVRRDGSVHEIPVRDLVPGDIVLVEAGDRIPADGRLFYTNNLEIEEAALTGESAPSSKNIDAVASDTSIGDRKCVAFMNSTVTRGRGELLVTSTGMSTEVGRIAHLLGTTDFDKSPLEKQLDHLAHGLAIMAGVIVAIVFIIGMISGESFSDQLLTAVALAVASIPEGLPAVTAVTLALGVGQMAKQHAIIKRLSSVETLGCTSVICSDKTGTLTVNQMTAQEIVTADNIFSITGEGYDPDGTITARDVSIPLNIDQCLVPAVLCNDAVIRSDSTSEQIDWTLVGDPTEGALVTLGMKAGLDVEKIRSSSPRLAEIPFDSEHKYMATIHSLNGLNEVSDQSAVMFVKGAPDVLLARCSTTTLHDHSVVSIDFHFDAINDHIQRLGASGLRALAVAKKYLTSEQLTLVTSDHVDGKRLHELVNDLSLVTVIGLIDPPRPEATQAIADAKAAGIDVKMITGDHVSTASTIGQQLGLTGSSLSGKDLDQLTDEQLSERLDTTSVFARVAPEHKLRLVTLLQSRRHVVAMTGDGVNDAPALKKADIGVAMGITGTEVTKEAATMVLTDDNFATIVSAVRRGRTIYDNIVKFVKFQLSTTLGFAIIFLAASIFDIAHRAPFSAIAILWVNIIMDGPPAMSLGVDKPASDTMHRRPRPLGEPILTKERWLTVGLAASVMAVTTTLVFAFAPGNGAPEGVITVASTMGFNTFVLAQFFNILNVRSHRYSAFSRYTFTNKWLWISLTAVIGLQLAVTHIGFAQDLFDTTDISLSQWLICIAAASSVLWVEEIRKLFMRTIDKSPK